MLCVTLFIVPLSVIVLNVVVLNVVAPNNRVELTDFLRTGRRVRSTAGWVSPLPPLLPAVLRLRLLPRPAGVPRWVPPR